ncbi:MAG: outer membrane protein assembly factor BamD [Alphaproteobacteria bacterium]|nr:outer membrane protein assembly factor BamD [Alphaproteobacteria bacterium]
MSSGRRILTCALRLGRTFGLALALVLAAGVALPRPASAQVQRKNLTVEEQYELGLRYMKRGYYVKALEQFNRIRNYHRDDPYAVKAELAIADVHYKKAEWDQARVAYEDFMRLHPRHEDIDYVVYRLGLTSFKKAPRIAARDQIWTRQAVNTWTGFDTRFADSEHVEEVQDLLTRARNRLARKEFIIGRFYYKRGAWAAVVGRMEGLLRTYPASPDAAEALAMLAIARWNLAEPEAARQAVERLKTDHPNSRALLRVRRRAPGLVGSVDAGGATEAAP